jgi:hypothetical protein
MNVLLISVELCHVFLPCFGDEIMRLGEVLGGHGSCVLIHANLDVRRDVTTFDL